MATKYHKHSIEKSRALRHVEAEDPRTRRGRMYKKAEEVAVKETGDRSLRNIPKGLAQTIYHDELHSGHMIHSGEIMRTHPDKREERRRRRIDHRRHGR